MLDPTDPVVPAAPSSAEVAGIVPHADIPLAGVIGWPVAHSRSPRLHRHWLDRYGINGHYVPLPVRPEHLAAVLRSLTQAGFVGANVTIPHKEAVLALADVVTDRAALMGAANTLIFRPDGRIHADNTDGYGFISNLKQYAPDWAAERGPAAVIGAGGAARAVVASLLEAGVPELRIANRTRIRAEQIKAEFGAKIVVYDWAHFGNMLDGARTVINATSLGMDGRPPLRLPLDALAAGTLVTDLVYTPLRTTFLAEAEARGARIVDGLGMLLHQAAPGFERWFGPRPEVDAAARAAVLA
ncbi:shikimate dehydrogenase [Paracoccus suum]|uniref:Shikimate dehydrogenase (NADP(+)) n=1 Tax=Paracoccus suum TaxID=2259340 RepID=A0A344PHS1_9RHOB|nr:shikimate dehydrogenase [Paracoccus suum]AXC48926.1 shikimate dehydrogenase [Paracoccus suum]